MLQSFQPNALFLKRFLLFPALIGFSSGFAQTDSILYDSSASQEAVLARDSVPTESPQPQDAPAAPIQMTGWETAYSPEADSGQTTSSIQSPQAPAKPQPQSETKPLDLKQITTETQDRKILETRMQLLQDSINALTISLGALTTEASSQIPSLRPKDEYETSDAFAKRQAEWKKRLDVYIEEHSQPLKKRRAELEKTLVQVRKQTAQALGSLEIESTPEGAKVLVNGEEKGVTPLSLDQLWAGNQQIQILLDGYQPYITVAAIEGGETTELEAMLQEKSIFSTAHEVNLSALLAKDTPSVTVYQARIEILKKRIAEVDGETQGMLSNVKQQNPLAPKGEFERQADFEVRQQKWKQSIEEKSNGIRTRHETYRTRLSRGIEVLQDYIVTQASTPKSILIPSKNASLESYNADSAYYSMKAWNNDPSYQFTWVGKLKMPLEQAKTVNKQTSGLTIQAQYYDIPVEFQGRLIYPALSHLDVSMPNQKFETQGQFQIPDTWLQDSRVVQVVAHADSLSRGLIETRNLTAEYALNFQSPNSGGNKNSRVWLYVARGLLFAGSITGFTISYLAERDASDLADDFNPTTPKEAKKQLDEIESKESRRDIALMVGGSLGIAGLISFAF